MRFSQSFLFNNSYKTFIYTWCGFKCQHRIKLIHGIFVLYRNITIFAGNYLGETPFKQQISRRPTQIDADGLSILILDNEFRLQNLGVKGKALKGHCISARGNAPGMGRK